MADAEVCIGVEFVGERSRILAVEGLVAGLAGEIADPAPSTLHPNQRANCSLQSLRITPRLFAGSSERAQQASESPQAVLPVFVPGVPHLHVRQGGGQHTWAAANRP